MDKDTEQLLRLAELIDLSAGGLREVVRERSASTDSSKLTFAAYELERLSADVRRIGLFPTVDAVKATAPHAQRGQ